MSYRHPRFYREDFTGFNRAMQQSFNTQFTSVMDYYDERIAERKQYETDLYACLLYTSPSPRDRG